MYTEDGARRNGCCRGEKTRITVSCSASDCMAWRWDKESTFTETKSHQHNMEIIDTKATDKEIWTGYCGLAGKP